jgi:hypothetical protein
MCFRICRQAAKVKSLGGLLDRIMLGALGLYELFSHMKSLSID